MIHGNTKLKKKDYLSDNFRGQNKIFLLPTMRQAGRRRHKPPPILKLAPDWSSPARFPTLYLHKENRHLLHSREAMKFGTEEKSVAPAANRKPGCQGQNRTNSTMKITLSNYTQLFILLL